jgi:hypothetical protein
MSTLAWPCQKASEATSSTARASNNVERQADSTLTSPQPSSPMPYTVSPISSATS